MSIERIESLLEGANPSFEDYDLVVSIAERCQAELLWSLLSQSPKAHWLVKFVLNKALQEKVPRQATEEEVQSIINKLEARK